MAAVGDGAMEPLTEASLGAAARLLADRDPVLRGILERHGPPPLWARPPGFATLVLIVLEQQVSLASAAAAFDRLVAVADPLTPAAFLALDDATLLRIGFSRQKARYVRLLAERVAAGRLDLDGLAMLDDGAATDVLVGETGIGPWSAAIYLLMALRRPDVWPATDLALIAALTEATGRPLRPTPGEMALLAEPWRPWRSVAARMLWVDYLARRGRS